MGAGESVSCLCVTRGRPADLARSIGGFLDQRHADKELVIVFERDDTATIELLSSRVVGSVVDDGPRTVVTPAGPIVVAGVDRGTGTTLGELRNIAVELARGDLFCQWDDDDLHDPRRIAGQLAALARSGKAACLLSRWLIHHVPSDAVYLSLARDCGWEGSLLCARADAPRYPHLRRGEDTPVVSALHARRAVVLLDRPELYVYRVHGSNTWSADHFREILERSEPRPPTAAGEVERLARRHQELFDRTFPRQAAP